MNTLILKLFTAFALYVLLALPVSQATIISSLSLPDIEPIEINVADYFPLFYQSLRDADNSTRLITYLFTAFARTFAHTEAEPELTQVHFTYEFWQGCFDYFGYDKCTENVCNDDGSGEGHGVCWPHDVYPPSDGCENQQVFCWDCGCSSSYYFCDGPENHPSNHWVCRLRPTSDNVSIVNQTSFSTEYEYNPTYNLVLFNYTIDNFPKQSTVSVLPESCTTSCTSTSGPCTADCVVTECEGDGIVVIEGEYRVYTKVCGVNVTIHNHNPQEEYTLVPTLSFELQILNPPSYARDHGGLPLTIPLSVDLNPVVFSTFYCGNSAPDQGETQDNCCWDVVCDDVPEIEYCNGGFEPELGDACTFMSGIALELVTPSSLDPIDICGNSHILEPFTVRLNNPPTDTNTTNTTFVLGGEPPDEIICTDQMDGTYICSGIVIAENTSTCNGPYIPVAPIQNNIATFMLEFPDGFLVYGEPEQGVRNITLQRSTDFLDIPIDVFDPTDGVCEDGLSENQTNSCMDCKCDDIFLWGANDFYCDESGSIPWQVCRNPDDFSLVTGALLPENKEVHTPGGDEFTFTYNITHFPLQDEAAVAAEACEVDTCVESDPTNPNHNEPCSADCDFLSCQSEEKTGQTLVRRECTLSISIDEGYNPLFDYDIVTEFRTKLTYFDLRTGGSIEHTSDLLTGTFNPISFGTGGYCGDGTVNLGETLDNCCYDHIAYYGTNACGEERYCDTRLGPDGPPTYPVGDETDVDVCEDLEEIAAFAEPPDPRELDAEQGTEITMDLYVMNIPRRTDPINFNGISCSFETLDGNPYSCEQLGITITDCTSLTQDGDKTRFSCTLTFPPLNCLESPFFDEENMRMLLSNGNITVPVQFYNGPHAQVIEKTTEIGSFHAPLEDCPEPELVITDISSSMCREMNEGTCSTSDALIIFASIENAPPDLTTAEGNGAFTGSVGDVPLATASGANCQLIEGSEHGYECVVTIPEVPFGEGDEEEISTTLYRCNLPEGDHMDTVDRNVCSDAGYTALTPLGHIYTAATSGRELYTCFKEDSGDHMTTADQRECTDNGYEDITSLGYVGIRPDMQVLYRCFNPTTDDHFDTTDLSECTPNDYPVSGMLGYVWPEGNDQRISLVRCQHSETGDRFTAVDCQDHDEEVILGHILAAEGLDSTALVTCRNPSTGDNATSSNPEEECTNEQGYPEQGDELGYIITDAENILSLYKCYRANLNDHMTSFSLVECQTQGYTVQNHLGTVMFNSCDTQTRAERDLVLTFNVQFRGGFGHSSQKPTQTLYRCYNSELTSHMDTLSDTCEGKEGYSDAVPFGEVSMNPYSAAQLLRCFNSETGDYMTTTDECGGEPFLEGYETEAELGYVKAIPESYKILHTCDDEGPPKKQLVTVRIEECEELQYVIRASMGYVMDSELENTQSLRRCVKAAPDATDYLITPDEECNEEWELEDTPVGYVFTEEIENTQPLYRCINSEDGRYWTTAGNECGDGYEEDKLLGHAKINPPNERTLFTCSNIYAEGGEQAPPEDHMTTLSLEECQDQGQEYYYDEILGNVFTDRESRVPIERPVSDTESFDHIRQNIACATGVGTCEEIAADEQAEQTKQPIAEHEAAILALALTLLGITIGVCVVGVLFGGQVGFAICILAIVITIFLGGILLAALALVSANPIHEERTVCCQVSGNITALDECYIQEWEQNRQQAGYTNALTAPTSIGDITSGVEFESN